MKPTWTEITETAKEPGKGWNNVQIAQFHYFNPNGLIRRKRNADDRISAAVDVGALKSGAIIAYGTFNSFWADNLIQLAKQNRVSSLGLSGAIRSLKEDIEKTEKVAAEAGF